MNDRRKQDQEMLDLIRKMTPDQRETFIQQLAVQMGESIEQVSSWIERFERGEVFSELDRLNAEVERIRAEVKRLEKLVAIHIPHGRAWMMALEMQYAALRKYQAQQLDIVNKLRSDGDLLNDREKAFAAERDVPITPEVLVAVVTAREVNMLKKAEAFWWSHDTATAALSASQSIPGGTVISEVVLPSRAGWWWFDKPIGVDLTGKGHGLAALLWESDDVGIYFTAYALDENDGPAFALGWSWGAGNSWEELRDFVKAGKGRTLYRSDVGSEKSHETIAHISRLFLAGCAWLQQKVVIETSGNIERHRRKQLAREDGTPPVRNDVRVIQLRRRDYSGVTHQPVEGERVNHEYSCRWVVSGHWRNQFYASTNERKLIYIMPFVKGPADKPMKTDERRVYAVSR